MSEPPLLEVVDLVKTYRLPRRRPVRAAGAPGRRWLA